MEVYVPAEDSRLLQAAVEKYAYGNVLDIGTGSGMQAISAAKRKKVKSVVAADLSGDALKFAAAASVKEGKSVAAKIKFIRSDLFGSIPKQKFDTIIFNPPYLPQDKGIEDATIYGGKKGYELIERFLNRCSGCLADKGIILLLFSSFSRKGKIDEIIESNCLESEEVGRKELPFFETLHVYKIKKSLLLLKLGKNGITEVKKFAEGNRGIIYTGILRGGKVAVKAKKADSAAKRTIENEVKWLKALNKKGIGPKLIFSGNGFFVYEFVEGQFIIDYLKACSREKAVALIKKTLRQCRALDELKVNKEELLRPQGHVIIRNGNPVMIDFERCGKTRKPKNVTQFCQFLIGGFSSELLRKKGISISREKILAAAKEYKNSQEDRNFRRILSLI